MQCIDLSETALLASVQADTYSSLYFDIAIDSEYCQGDYTDINNYTGSEIEEYLLDPNSVDQETFDELYAAEYEGSYCATSHLFN